METNDIKIMRGGNCNVECDYSQRTAKKTLRNTSSKEKIDRFRTEIHIAEALKGMDDVNIARIIETHEEQNIKNCYILMELYEHTLGDFLDRTIGNVRYTFDLLLPIIKTLSCLATLENPIFHRDLKPDNVLSDGNRLFLSDFGIAYVDDESERKTSTLEAVGARLFLAPEYELGRVDNIDEKGDIYSLGKIIWYLINGKKEELLPYNLWFENRYNLSLKYPKVDGIHFANYIILNCLEIDPKKRIGYKTMIENIEAFLADSFDTEPLEIKLKANVRNAEYDQALTYNKDLEFLYIVSGHLEEVGKRLRAIFDESPLVDSLIGALFISKRVPSAARMGPIGSIETSTYGNYFLRTNFLSNQSGDRFVEIDFLMKPQQSVGKVTLRQQNGRLSVNWKPFTSEILYSEFLAIFEKLIGQK